MSKLEEHIGYHFTQAALLSQALMHPSKNAKASNQRLEFLGDSVLGMVVAELLYQRFPHEQEGELARRQAALVRGETLAQAARDCGLGEALQLSSGEEATGGRSNASNLEDALEALIGAIYLDGGIEAAKAFILPRWEKLADSISTPPKDAKTSLQEWAQARKLGTPSYTLLNQTGSAHAPEFTIEVSIAGKTATASAGNKRSAEQEAAAKLLLTCENS